LSFQPLGDFGGEFINLLISLWNAIEIPGKKQAKNALEFAFQGMFRSTTTAALLK
jgi:hypothetical protein